MVALKPTSLAPAEQDRGKFATLAARLNASGLGRDLQEFGTKMNQEFEQIKAGF